MQMQEDVINPPDPRGWRIFEMWDSLPPLSTRLNWRSVPRHFIDRKAFWAKVNVYGPTVRPELGSCWEWTASLITTGYGAFWAQGQCHPANRISWILEHRHIPDGLSVLHSCDNPLCVRPSHLFLGTSSHNIADAIKKGRHNGSAKVNVPTVQV